jgi:CheY-like chemotaxis protein
MQDNSPILSNPKRKQFNILICEDDTAISNLLKMQLELAGYNVLTAISGKISVSTIMESKPNFILMDISMPELNGFEVIDNLKNSNYDTSSFELVFLSNSSTPGDIDKAHGYGAEYKIKAELSPKELISLIDSKLKIN